MQVSPQKISQLSADPVQVPHLEVSHPILVLFIINISRVFYLKSILINLLLQEPLSSKYPGSHLQFSEGPNLLGPGLQV